MTMMLTAQVRALEMSAWFKAEILPIVLFFGMFFVVFGVGGLVVRHLPRKSGSMLDEILSETWDDDEEDDEQIEKAEMEPEKTEDMAQPSEASEVLQPKQADDDAEDSSRK